MILTEEGPGLKTEYQNSDFPYLYLEHVYFVIK